MAFNLRIYLTLSIFHFVHVNCADYHYEKDLNPSSKSYLSRREVDADDDKLASAHTPLQDVQDYPCLYLPHTFTSTHLNFNANPHYPNCPVIVRIGKCPKQFHAITPAYDKSLILDPPLDFSQNGSHYSFHRIAKLTWKSHLHKDERSYQCCESNRLKANSNVYHHPEGSLQQKIPVKEVLTNSSSSMCKCIVLIGQLSNLTREQIDNDDSEPQNNYRSMDSDEKRVNKSMKQVMSYLDYDDCGHLFESDGLLTIRNCLQAFFRNNDDKGGDANELEERQRSRRGTISNSMIYPTYRYLQERKRSGMKWADSNDDNSSRSKYFPKGDEGFMEIRKTGNEPSSSRTKREIHVLMARYRKTTKTKRNSSPCRQKRPKPKSDCNDKDNKVNPTPYAYLNVSFTGFSEHVERSTVKPRVPKPLKMTPEDMEWVYEQPKTKKPKKSKTRFKAVINGPSSQFKFRVRS